MHIFILLAARLKVLSKDKLLIKNTKKLRSYSLLKKLIYRTIF